MSFSTDETPGGIPIRLFSGTKKINEGLLSYRREGPVVELEMGTILEDPEGLVFTFSDISGISLPVERKTRFVLMPEIITALDYSTERASRFEMYPPISDKWLV